MSPRARAARGFTLIEVLVALIIVALGMGALMSALTSSADSVQRLREKSFAEWVGLNQLAAARLARTQPSEGKSEGDVDFAGGRWHWVQQVSAMEIPGLRRIEVQVRRLPGVAKAESGNDAAASAAAGAAAARSQSTAGKESIDWLATVTGFRGDAVAAPQGTLPEWDTLTQASGTDGPGNTGPPSTNPGKPGGVAR